MLTLNDGRSELWQWDTGRKLTVDADCSQVHFSNKIFGRSIDVDVVDGVAIIPDILLQTDKELTAWAFVGTPENGYTKISKVFKVNKRNKPADYVFTPPEQTTLSDLVERLDEIEKNQDPDAIKNSVEDYLEQNPVEAPVKSVNGQTGEVKLTAEDVGAISQDDLQEATDKALAQAKESGAFDGADGKDGADGQDGYTPVKGVDYMTPDEIQAAVEQVSGIVMGQVCRVSVVMPEIGNAYADKTSSEIYAAWQAKAPIYCYVDLNYGEIPLMLSPFVIKEETAIFAQISKTDGSTTCIMVTITGNTVEVEAFDIATKEDVPTDAHINSLIDAKLGVIENGTY